MTTIFGPDISSYEAGLDLSRLGSASFVLAKTTEGTYYTDAYYDGWRQQAAKLGKPFVWYHFLSGEDVHAQVAHCTAHLGDKSLPGMLDVEPTTSYTPTLRQALDWIDAAHDAGLNLRLAYIPRWVHQQWGSPSLTGLKNRGVALVSSSYPGGTGAPINLYPGDGATGWQPYGDVTPLIYQYTDQASDGGQSMDYNAFRGSVTQLAAFLHSPTSAATTGGAMSDGTIPPAIKDWWPILAKDFPPNAPFSAADAAIWAKAAAMAAGYGVTDANRKLDEAGKKIDQLLARPVPPPIDLAALAALIDQHQTAGAGAEEIAKAVMRHLSAATAGG